MAKKGFVSLVGAGPGDAELMTVKAVRLLQQADVVVYDRLVSADILSLIPAGVSRISVGKEVGKHCVPQQQINEIIVNLAKAGRKIVRLKGGDPYLFGRGGEEVQALNEQQIAFEVVPGITAASGCSSYSGIPLTHRGMSRRVQLITGHFNDNEPLDLNWQSIADPDSTIVIYMGLSNLPLAVHSLIDAGLPASTPAAAVQNGTTQAQQRVITTLDQLNDAIHQRRMKAPVMIIIGQVVSLADELDWFQLSLDENRLDENRLDENRLEEMQLENDFAENGLREQAK
ncbi:MAG: uroporphyrinogen-III C-methyltransferase [Gammaproteobacteria bacterium]|nr:uroporphyrinogen-III C-methyltransferase [Gammaproteobacteria bacterium]